MTNKEWPMEKLAEQFRQEIRERFERENAASLAQEREEIAEVKAKLDAEGKPYPDWLDERPSFLREIYDGCDIQIVNNSVKVVLPRGFAHRPEFVEMFDGTSVAWSRPTIGATIIDGEPHVTIELILIDYWDDERYAKWRAERAQWKGTTAEDLLRRIQNAQREFAQESPPKRPIDGLCTVEYWCEEYFRARENA